MGGVDLYINSSLSKNFFICIFKYGDDKERQIFKG